jgi:germination protein M
VRPPLVTVAVVACGLALAACGREQTRESARPRSPSTEARAQTTPTRLYQVWFTQGDTNLELLWDSGPDTEAPAAAALRLLLTTRKDALEPYNLDSAIPPGTRLLGIDLRGDVATVDLSSGFASAPDARSLAFRSAQVVYTATQFPTVRAVRFRIGGRPIAVPSAQGTPIDRPVGRKDYETLLPAIVVESPPPDVRVSSPLVVSGTANVFEANVTLRILNARRNEIARTFTTATCGTGCRGTFRGTIGFRIDSPQRGTLVVQDDDADGDGFPSHAVSVPVRLVP